MAKHERNRGAVALAQTGETQQRIATKTKTTRVQVGYFMTGQRKPGRLNRARLKEVYGIEESWWDEQPRSPKKTTAPSTFAEQNEQLRRTFEQLKSEILADTKTTRREKIGELKDIFAASVAADKAIAEMEAAGDAKLVDMPVFRKMVEEVTRALEPWPDAMRAAGEALLGGKE